MERTHATDQVQEEQLHRVELSVSRLLRLGTAAATALMGAGMAIMLLQLPSTLGPTLITVGLVTLVCTPLLRVAAALVLYLRMGDLTYTIISLTVLAIVFTGILLGQAH